MSRREGRDSDSRRHRSRFDREPSPKRSRRDGKPETERVVSNNDVGDRADQGERQRRRLQDALPLETSSAHDSSKIDSGTVNKESDRKNNGHHQGTKNSSDPTEVPRSRSYFQHDERGNAAQAGRSFGRRAAAERGGRDAKDQHDERETKTYERRQRDEKPQTKGDGNGDWRHDRYFEMEADPLPQPPPTRKRPAFSEKKIPAATQSTDNTTKEPEKASHSGHHVIGSERRHVIGSERRVDRDRNPQHLDRQDRLTAGDQVPNRREAPRGGFSSRERPGVGGGDFRRRDRFSGRQGYRSGGTRVEKWKHDLFDEANKSPPRKNEEDQIAKVESLLAS
ncbi:hepatoma-derived growth factor-related protein 2-like [Durio zibethinus]|uniref:Hepatoma-derived growth factor-related protein 2-like n=1 Tax=Durio zibethinus TaxID=66656 RepID=A0A6P5XBM3_DURZI|nr:hepatoma-derived growth factor-related protein 2-like [Durio zibethinus]